MDRDDFGDLFGYDPPPPRKGISYQHTSREAWQSLLPVSAALDRLIMQEIEGSGPNGITCQDIEHRIGRSHQAVSGNLRHLAEKGLVEASGKFGLTESGRRAIRWRVPA